MGASPPARHRHRHRCLGHGSRQRRRPRHRSLHCCHAAAAGNPSRPIPSRWGMLPISRPSWEFPRRQGSSSRRNLSPATVMIPTYAKPEAQEVETIDAVDQATRMPEHEWAGHQGAGQAVCRLGETRAPGNRNAVTPSSDAGAQSPRAYTVDARVRSGTIQHHFGEPRTGR